MNAQDQPTLSRALAENARLKSENERLKGRAKSPPAPKRGLKNMIKKSSVILLVSAAVALLTSANLLFWFGNTAVKPDRFAAAAQPIIKDPKVQQGLALYAT